MKSMKSAGALVMLLAVVVQGCALKPQKVQLDPDVGYTGEVAPSEILVGFAVADTRPTKKLGEVADAHQTKVDVTIDGDFVPLLTERLAAGIEQRGFKVAAGNPAINRTLMVKVNNMTLNSVKTPLTFRTELRAEVTAVAYNESDYYERVYYVRTYQDTAGPPYEKQSAKLINQALSQALTEVLKDDKLFSMLAR